MSVTIYHNPACSTSRKVLAAIRETGADPVVVEYLNTPPSRAELTSFADRIGVPLRDLLRRKAPQFKELGLDDPAVSDDAILDAIDRHPVLIERPIVVTAKGVRLCRPPEKLREIL